ncbi:hypothetical protein CDAR_615181 [Caerostris darwini]|uniref:Uncharacterized protein n=1 Tax=Caerostris darwini TaxID=1538125 RepID=A0AAV4RAQ4_9ARAC|nr:hypothetical protein CDAR_615181 [Caerostris darwini]
MEEWLLPPPLPFPSTPPMRGRGEEENPLKYPRVQSHKNERQKGGKLFSKECPFFSMASVILPPYPVRAVVLYPFPGGKFEAFEHVRIKNHPVRLTAPMTSRQSRHLEKKSGLFTPRLARVPLSVPLCAVVADNTFRALHHSAELTNPPARQLVH